MTNIQARLLSASLVVVAGALSASSPSLNVNFGIVIIILGIAVYVAEYVRSYTRK